MGWRVLLGNEVMKYLKVKNNNDMKKKSIKWCFMLSIVLGGLTSCGLDIPKEVPSSFQTMTVEKKNIDVPMKFSAN